MVGESCFPTSCAHSGAAGLDRKGNIGSATLRNPHAQHRGLKVSRKSGPLGGVSRTQERTGCLLARHFIPPNGIIPPREGRR